MTKLFIFYWWWSNDCKKAATDKNKIYILPDYKCNHVKTTVSDLKDEDFTKAAYWWI